MDVMKKLATFICIFALASCATETPEVNNIDPARDQKFKTAYKQIGNQCKLARQNKVYKTRLDMVQKCSKPKITKLAKDLNMPNKDLINSMVAESESLARKLDNNEITQSEADTEYSNFMVSITQEENRRKARASR